MNRLKLRPMLAAMIVSLLVPSMAIAADEVVVRKDQTLVAKEPIIPSLDRISWSAVLAGVVVALATHAALSTLGVGIGAAAIDPQNRQNPAGGVPTAMLLWMFVSGLIALFAGGWVSGRLAGTVPFDSSIHGVIMWSFATILLLVLATTSAGAILGGMFRLLGAGVSATGSAVGGVASAAGSAVGGVAMAAGTAAAAVAPQIGQMAKDAGVSIPHFDWKGIQKEAKKMLQLGNSTEGNEQGKKAEGDKQGANNNAGGQGNQSDKPEDNKGENKFAKMREDKDEVIEMVGKAFGAVRDGGLSNADRDDMLAVISERAGMSKEEANKTLENWEKKYREVKQQYDAALAQAEQKARDAAEATTKAISRVAIWTFASLLAGVIVSAIGGNIGSTYMRL
jgi:hypothetical protein